MGDTTGRALNEVGIADGQSESDPIGDLGGLSLMKVILDGWTSASVAFLVSENGTDFFPLLDKDGEYEIADPSGINGGVVAITLDPVIFAGWSYIKICSGPFAARVAQTPARSIIPIVREVA